MKTTKIDAGHYRVTDRDGNIHIVSRRDDAPGYAGTVWMALDQRRGQYTIHATKKEALDDIAAE